MATRVKFTAKVKRGLVTMRAVVLDGLDPSASPLRWAMKKWTRAEERDFNAALAWMEQVEDDLNCPAVAGVGEPVDKLINGKLVEVDGGAA